MAVRAPRSNDTLIRVNGGLLIKGFAIAVWLFGWAATTWLMSRFVPTIDPNNCLLPAAIVQALLTIGQLKVVRRYFGGLPTVLFIIDTATNALALLDIPFELDYTSAGAYLRSLFTGVVSGEWYVNVPLVILFVFIGYKVATTPESVIDVGGEA